MEIIKLGNEILRQKAERIQKIDGAIHTLAAEMLNMLEQKKGVGLAGPQVGVLKRIFVIKLVKEPSMVFINPSILKTAQETVKYEEGCLSVPGVWADVIRPATVAIQAWNEKGRPFTIEASGLLARAILHEFDHLEGVLFIDHLSELKRTRLLAKFNKL
ncbi:MAG: peptide deformylase [Treponema sp.]|jgi:peptide deformylase|nr:peptide deformylase [Treponema sp.]